MNTTSENDNGCHFQKSCSTSSEVLCTHVQKWCSTGVPRGTPLMGYRVWSKNSCGLTFVVFEEASKPFATPNRACRFRAPADSRNEQDIPFPLMISLVVIQVHNSTPIISHYGTSATRGIRGTAAQSSSTTRLCGMARRSYGARSSTKSVAEPWTFRSGCLIEPSAA